MNPSISTAAYRNCQLCPRTCKVNRELTTGFCGCTSVPKAARAALHHWEEPCISGPEKGSGGSGAVFFSGCTLKCCFCQNHPISSGGFGKELTSSKLARIFLELQEQGAYNLNLVTATQFLPDVIAALEQVKGRLHIPVVYNCGGYERVETILALKDYIDIWLPDFKYFDNSLARLYSSAPDYFERASAAIEKMIQLAGPPIWEDGRTHKTPSLLKRGVIIRHMVLPSHRQDSIALLRWISSHYPKDRFLISLLSQYTPCYHCDRFPEINRPITSYEYDQVVEEALRLGLVSGYMQKRNSARKEYTPPFDLEGL